MISITQHAMAPPPLFNAGQGEKIFIIEDLGDKVAEIISFFFSSKKQLFSRSNLHSPNLGPLLG